jgi:hypothetical protein
MLSKPGLVAGEIHRTIPGPAVSVESCLVTRRGETILATKIQWHFGTFYESM